MLVPAARFRAISPDLVSPTIVVTSPTGGSYKTGVITLQATAADDRGVVGVQWQIDGVNVGVEITAGGSWDYAFDTSILADGDHTVSAVARDAVGHTTTSLAVTMHVANPSTVTVHNFHTFNPIGGGSRRPYGATGTFASPNYTDGSGGAWIGNAYSNWGYVIQVRMVWAFDSNGHGYEDINGVAGAHATGIAIGSTQYGATLLDNTPSKTTLWQTISDLAAGTVILRDWLKNAGGVGGTAYTGDITLQYRYQ